MLNFKLSGNTFKPHARKLYEKTNVLNVNEHARVLSAAAGTLLYVISLTGKKSKLGNVLRYGALYMIYRGISGNCAVTAALNKSGVQKHVPAVNIRTSFIADAPRKLVYDTWRDFEKLPDILKHVKKITVIDEIHSQWVIKTKSNLPAIEWNAEIIEQEDERELSWRSLPGSTVATAGKLNFADAGSGTKVDILISYRPPAGYIGSTLAKYFNPTFKRLAQEDFLKFKNYVEKKAIKTKETF